MILLVDIGNSNLVIGFAENGEILHKARLATDHTKTSDQYWIELKGILGLFRVSEEEIEGAIISSVVPPVLVSCRTALKRLLHMEPLVVGPGIKTGLNILADNPAQVGSDLIVASVAALQSYPAPMLIVDMGTATTISALDKNGSFLGGSISPGIRISSEALSSKTAQLPFVGLEAPKKAIGRNTVDCMKSGIVIGAAASLDGLLDRMEEELGQKATVIATGGISRHVIPLCRREIIYDSDLLLKGLVILYDRNRKSADQTGGVLPH